MFIFTKEQIIFITFATSILIAGILFKTEYHKTPKKEKYDKTLTEYIKIHSAKIKKNYKNYYRKYKRKKYNLNLENNKTEKYHVK